LKITSIVQEDPGGDDESGFSLDEYVEIKPTNLIRGVDVESPVFMEDDFLEFLEEEFDYRLTGNPCGQSASGIFTFCFQAGSCSDFVDTSTVAQRRAMFDALDEAMAEKPPAGWNCFPEGNDPPPIEDSLADIGLDALELAGYDDPTGFAQIRAILVGICDFAPFPSFLDGAGFFTLKCLEPGEFEVAIADEDSQGTQLDISCRGEPSDKSTLSYSPTAIEIAPSASSLSHSMLVVNLLDEDGFTPGDGFEVEFHTDRCSIETSGVDTVDELVLANAMFASYSPADPASVTMIEESAAAQAKVDSTPQEDFMDSVTIGDPPTSNAAAILGCSYDDDPDVTPGIANVTVVIELEGKTDITLKAQILVVGPPAFLSITAAPANVRCGESVKIDVTVVDAVQQAVSNLTIIDATTNFGGILGGTGAVAGQAGNVVPLSSTVAETFGGIATFWLLTSETHVGSYEVVIFTGGSLTNSEWPTPEVVLPVTVACFVPEAAPAANAAAGPSAAPTAAAPSAGTVSGVIRPPSTGDGGLAGERPGGDGLVGALAAGAIAVAAGVGVFLRRLIV
jgi:hypothetical protein